MLSQLAARVRALRDHRQIDADLDDEVRFHVESEIEANVARGMTPAEARRVALRDLGGVTQTKEAVHEVHGLFLDTAWRHLRYAARALRRARGFSATVIATLAIAIACPTLIFSVARVLVLRPLPYADAEHLVAVTPELPLFFWRVVEEVRNAEDVFERLGVCTTRAVNVSGGGAPERVLAGGVDAAFLSLTGVRPALGRLFRAEEFDLARDKVAVLSDAMWRRRFGASLDVVGRTVALDSQAYTIVGVLPAQFRTPDELKPARDTAFDKTVGLLIPLSGSPRFRDPASIDHFGMATIVGRLRPGVPLERARAVVALVTRRALPVGPDVPAYTVASLRDAVAGSLPRQLGILACAVGLLFVVGCANIANLMLERFHGRRAELSVRVALGASSRQLLGSVVAEALLLAGAGGAAGLAAVWIGHQVVATVAAPTLTGLDGLRIDVRILGFAMVASVGTGLAIALAPAVRLVRSTALRAVADSPSAPRLRGRLAVPSVLVLAQVAMSVILAVAGTFLARDFLRSVPTGLGYRTDGILTAEASLAPLRYRWSATTAFFDDLTRASAALPGVRAAALTSLPPGAAGLQLTSVLADGRAPQYCRFRVVSDDYFSVLGIPIVAGRFFDSRDGAASPIVFVVNEAFALKYWESPRRALAGQLGWGTPPVNRAVVGVVGDTREPVDGWQKQPMVYVSYRQMVESRKMTLLLLARSGSPGALALPLTRAVRRLDPDQPLYNVETLERIIGSRLANARLLLATMTLFAVVTLLLAAVGVYGVMAYSVTLRTREIGVRVALGGSARGILALMLRRGLWLIGGGIGLGLPVAIAVIWSVQPDLVDLGFSDVRMCAFALTSVLCAGLLASLAPTLRAVRIDPITTLRAE